MPRATHPQAEILADSSELPVVHVSYHTEHEVTIRELAAGLRKRNFPVYIVPFDLDPTGDILLANIRPHVARTQILCLALTLSARQWIQAHLRNAILDAVGDQLDEIYVLKLADLAEADVPRAIRGYRTFDLARDHYEAGFEQLVDALGLVTDEELATPEAVQQHATVTGVFEIARSQSDMFIELKNQIYRDHRFDHKYLYWDVRAALRWQRLAELSTYMTNQMSMNILAVHSDSIIGSILHDSEARDYSFINFGVGTGEKDFHILDSLLRLARGTVVYFPIDESLSLIQMTIQSLQDLMARYGARLRVHYVLDDFVHVDLFEGRLSQLERGNRRADPVRIIGFLGGSLGNFREREILARIQTLMGPRDYLIVGVEFVGAREDADLIDNYSGKRMREFLYGPILDVEGAPKGWWHNDNWDQNVIANDRDRTDVDRARTIVVYAVLKDEWIETVYSTKYDREALERFFVSVGFRTVAAFVSDEKPPRYGKYVLALA